MATENTVMAAVARAGRDRDRQRRLRAARPGSLPLPRLARRRDRGASSRTSCGSTASTQLSGGEWRIGPEHIEVGSFIGLAAVTGGDVTIDDVEPKDLAPILPTFERLGVHVEIEGSTLRVPPDQELVIRDDLGGQIPKIEDGPWPAFPADLTSIAVTVATQARGTILIFEKMFESRLFFVDKLVSMGARIILCDPHRAVVTGPAKLYGQRMSSPDIRAGHGDAARRPLRRGDVDDRQHRRDRPRLRANRRAAALARRAHRARRGLVARTGQADEAGRLHARVDVAGSGKARVATGLPVLDHLLGLLRRVRVVRPRPRGRAGRGGGRGRGRGARARPCAGGRAPGGAQQRPRLGGGAGGRGAGHVVVEASGRPLVVSNVDLSDAPRRRPGERPRRDVPARARGGRRADAARPPARRRRPGARARGDLQGAGRRSGAELPASPEGGVMEGKTAVRTEEAPAPFQGAPYSQAIRANGLRLRLRPARAAARPRGDRRRRDRGADRAGLREPPRDPRGGRQRPRPAREDDRLPHRPRRLRRDERGLRPPRRRCAAGPGHDRGGGASVGRQGRDRGDRRPRC